MSDSIMSNKLKEALHDYFFEKLDELKKKDLNYWSGLLVALWELGEPNKVVWDTVYSHIEAQGRCWLCYIVLVDHLFSQPDAESFMKELVSQ